VRPDALNVFGFGTFIAGNDVKRHFISFVQGLETLADDGGVVNEDVLAWILCYEAEAFFVVPPFNFAAGHS